MNERIQEVLAEATKQTIDVFGAVSYEVDYELFAELIVHRCVGISKMLRPRNGHKSSENAILDKVEASVHKYFGVEPQNINDLWKTSATFREYFGVKE